MVRIRQAQMNLNNSRKYRHRPVIESGEFYRLFPALKRRLDEQVVTHRSAGEFLHMMKTLMAKLKVRVVYYKKGHHVSYSCSRRTIGALCLVRTYAFRLVGLYDELIV